MSDIVAAVLAPACAARVFVAADAVVVVDDDDVIVVVHISSSPSSGARQWGSVPSHGSVSGSVQLIVEGRDVWEVVSLRPATHRFDSTVGFSSHIRRVNHPAVDRFRPCCWMTEAVSPTLV